jgi:hypothetical protein
LLLPGTSDGHNPARFIDNGLFMRAGIASASYIDRGNDEFFIRRFGLFVFAG